MITAPPSPLHEAIFRPWLRWMLRRHYDSVQLLGSAPALDPQQPLLLLPNHNSWWDGFFVHLLNRKLWKRPFHILMLREQLVKNPFFARLGAYSIDPGKRREVLAALRETLRLLALPKHPAPLVVLFPQGELQPYGRRPLKLQEGASWVAQRAAGPLVVLPLAMRVELLERQLPGLFFLFGEPIRLGEEDEAPGTAELEGKLSDLMDELSRRIALGEEGRILLEGTAPLNERIERMTRRLKRAFGGGRRS